MSDPILPLAVWEEGTLQNDVPANDNALRIEAMRRPVIGTENAPTSTSDGDVFIVGSSPSGDFSSFDPDDLTIYRGGNWYAWAPVEGLAINSYIYSGSSGWIPSGGSAVWGTITGTLDDQTDLAASLDNVSIVTEGSTSTMTPATHSGRRKYVRAAGDVTFDSAQSYSAGQVYNIRSTSSIDLIEDGVTLTVPSGGTLALTAGMTVSVIMTSGTAGDVIGQTVPA